MTRRRSFTLTCLLLAPLAAYVAGTGCGGSVAAVERLRDGGVSSTTAAESTGTTVVTSASAATTPLSASTTAVSIDSRDSTPSAVPSTGSSVSLATTPSTSSCVPPASPAPPDVPLPEGIVLGAACSGAIEVPACIPSGWACCEGGLWVFTTLDPTACGFGAPPHFAYSCGVVGSSTAAESSGSSSSIASASSFVASTSAGCLTAAVLGPGAVLPEGIAVGGDCAGDIYTPTCNGMGWMFCDSGLWAYTEQNPGVCGLPWTIDPSYRCGGQSESIASASSSIESYSFASVASASGSSASQASATCPAPTVASPPPGVAPPAQLPFGGPCTGDVYFPVCRGAGYAFCHDGVVAFTESDPACAGWTVDSAASCGTGAPAGCPATSSPPVGVVPPPCVTFGARCGSAAIYLDVSVGYAVCEGGVWGFAEQDPSGCSCGCWAHLASCG